MTSFPKVQFAAFNITFCIQLKNALTGRQSHMIDKACSSISELYRVHEFLDDTKRLVTINDLLESKTFAVRESDRVVHGVSSS